jgi:50S ribosomal protein L16 3-hydroxylase
MPATLPFPDLRTRSLPPLPQELTAAAFVAHHWHKKPLLVRAALPAFRDLFSRAELFALAGRDDVEARLIVREGARWQLSHGPFRRAELNALPKRNWTLLIQGVNLHDDRADALLRRFAFLPYARLDDLMISYAVPGGGVGPHVDSYDVFLLQGAGRRRWRYGRQKDNRLRGDVPLKILERFTPRHDAVLVAGDMLYLPPHVAHDGVALDACTTYSIGFRAAGATELAHGLLDFLRDEVELPGRYADSDLAANTTPARIDAAAVARFAALLGGLRVTPALFRRFLGTWLSEPKNGVVFDPPDPAMTRSRFLARARHSGLKLDRRTQMLYDAQRAFINGNVANMRTLSGPLLRALANDRALAATSCAALDGPMADLLHQWYCDGYLDFGH